MCAFDNKRYIQADNIHTLSYGHKDLNVVLEIDEVRDAQRNQIIAAVEARRKGLIWPRRKGVVKRLGFDPAQDVSEGEEEAVAAGREMRARQRARLTQVPDLPDRYDPTTARPPCRRTATPDPDAPPPKLRRVQLPSISDDEDLPSESRTQPDTAPFRLASESETEETHPSPHSGTQIVLNMLFGEKAPSARPTPPTVERSGPSHGGVALAAPTPRETQRRFSSDDDEEEWVRPRRGRGRQHDRRSNPFIQFEAEEGESDAESESPPRCALATANTQRLTPSHHSDEDSSDSSDLDDTFIAGDDCFE